MTVKTLAAAALAAALAATAAHAGEPDFRPTQPAPGELRLPAPVAPAPQPDAWIRPIPVPGNPGVVGGGSIHDHHFGFEAREHGGSMTYGHDF